MNTEFLIPFIALLLSYSWTICSKALSERNYDDVPFYDTTLFNAILGIIVLCIVAGIIISWVNAGFLIFLAYLGIAVATIFVAQFTISPILISVFGYQGITGTVLPIICAIASAIWMLCQTGSFS